MSAAGTTDDTGAGALPVKVLNQQGINIIPDYTRAEFYVRAPSMGETQQAPGNSCKF